MRLVIVADVFLPLRSSGAVQLRDLSVELVRQGHEVTVLVAAPGLASAWSLEEIERVRVVRLRTSATKDVSNVRRAISEFLMPFLMLLQLRRSAIWFSRWDGVIWYSPTIFLGLVAHVLKVRSRCLAYLIVRDIFPEWAADMGLMRRGLFFHLFKVVAAYQYSVADVIGVQTLGNCKFFAGWQTRRGKRVEVLPNWLAPAHNSGCSIALSSTPLAGRKIIVYAGNMGVAQRVGSLLTIAKRWKDRTDIGFVLVGRGSEALDLKRQAKDECLTNVLFFDEIEPNEIPGLYAQCHVGAVVLDPRHTTHNIPGKFLTYMQAGLPVLAIVNAGNDIVELIQGERVGIACTDVSPECLSLRAEQLLIDVQNDRDFAVRCRLLWEKLFSVSGAGRQIVRGLMT